MPLNKQNYPQSGYYNKYEIVNKINYSDEDPDELNSKGYNQQPEYRDEEDQKKSDYGESVFENFHCNLINY